MANKIEGVEHDLFQELKANPGKPYDVDDIIIFFKKKAKPISVALAYRLLSYLPKLLSDYVSETRKLGKKAVVYKESKQDDSGR